MSRVRLGSAVLLMLFLSSCGLERRVNLQYEVEVAPNQWLTLREQRGWAWFTCEWNGKTVTWPGKRNSLGDTELPMTLRAYRGSLYLITLDRERGVSGLKYVYYKLNSAETRFVKISPADFPKQIATQNMSLDPRTRFSRSSDGEIDGWKVIRELDFESPGFRFTPMGEIWLQLETGLDRSGVKGLSYDLQRQIIRDFARKNGPIALTNLVKENLSQP